jgi:hypothetical protein
MTNFTDKEITFLESFISKLYAEPGFSDVSAEDFADEYPTQQHLGGVMASLTEKGVIYVEDHRDSGCDYDIIYLQSEFYKHHKDWADYEDIDYVPLRSASNPTPTQPSRETTSKEKEMNGKTIIVFNTKSNKVAFQFSKKPTNDQLDAACEAVPNGFADSIENLTAANLVAIYNANSGSDVKNIKKFINKPTAIERTAEVLADVPEFDGEVTTPVPDGNGDNSALSAGVAKSWTDPDVRKRRSQRHGVKVAGKEFPSLQAAYREFGLDEKDHREFRMLLKSDCSKKHKRHGKTWQAFER